MRAIKLFTLLCFLFFIACDDDNEVNPDTCSDGIQNGDEAGIDCGGSCGVCEVTCEPEVTFPTDSELGTNVLRPSDSDIDTLQVTPFSELVVSASTEICNEIKIEFTRLEGECDLCWLWFGSGFGDFEWETSDIDRDGNSLSQTITSTGSENEITMFNLRGGLYQIDYYINDSLTHTNFIRSTEDELEVFMEDAAVSRFKQGSNALYISSNNIFEESLPGSFGTIDVEDPEAGVSNVFLANSISSAIAEKDGELFYWEPASKEIKKVDIMSADPTPVTVLSNIDRAWDLAFDGDTLFMGITLSEETNQIVKVDLTLETPELEIIYEGNNDTPFSEFNTFVHLVVENETLYIASSFGDFATIDLNDESYSVNYNAGYFDIEPNGMDITDTYVYYTSSGIVGRINLTTQENEVLVSSNAFNSFADVHVEDEYLIFSNPENTTIYKKDF